MPSPAKKNAKKGGKKKKKANENDVMHNVDKAFYELQILDLNRKLARQRSRVAELEETVIQLDSKLGKVSGDHGDIISYLKRSLSERHSEVNDLQLQIAALTELNAAQLQKYESEKEELHEEYNNMKEQLTSQIKMYLGQLNALDEFRMQREELLLKFEAVQNELDTQELKFRKQMYEMEKKNILGKDGLKREMEERLFNLANKYQEANQIRLAATSQRIVRENIALNNELNILTLSTNDLDNENLLIKQQFKDVVLDYRMLEAGYKKSINKYSVQAGVVKDLVTTNLNQKRMLENYESEILRGIEMNRKLKELQANEALYNNRIKQLENRLNAARYSQRDLQTLLTAEINYRHHLGVIVEDALLLVKSTLFEHPEFLEKVQLPNKENFFTTIIELLTFTKVDVVPLSSHSTISSISVELPALSYLPKVINIADRKPPINTVNVMTHLGASFQNFLKQQETKTESAVSIQVETEATETIGVSGPEELATTSSIDEQSSSINAQSSADLIHLKSLEEEEEQMEEEIIEEGITEEEKMDEEKLTNALDDTY